MIEIKNLGKRFENTYILTGINLQIKKGEPVVLFGPTGCGKTTLLRLIAGLETPDSGTISIEDREASRPGWVLHPSKRNLCVVFQSHALWPHMTIEKNILFGIQGIDKYKAVKRMNDIITETGLEGLTKRYPHQLSGGQAKRASLARALIQEKGFYLMDEPLANQDENMKGKLVDLIIKKISERKAGLLYITHDIDEAQKISEKIVRIEKGRIGNCQI